MNGKPVEDQTVSILDAERKGADSMSKDIHVEKYVNFKLNFSQVVNFFFF